MIRHTLLIAPLALLCMAAAPTPKTSPAKSAAKPVAAKPTALTLPVLSCRFLEEKDGEARIVSFYAKKARGLMARYAIDNRIERAADLRSFDVAGYRFVPELSTDAEFTFLRPQPEPISPARKTA